MMPVSGSRILRIDAFGTAAFVMTAFGGVARPGFLRNLAAVVALALFTAGCSLSLWAIWLAIQRSRQHEVGMGGLFFLAGSTAPGSVRRPFNLLLMVQVLVGLATAIGTFRIKPFTPLAFGVLVPMFGLGLSGLWSARYGVFGARTVPGPRGPRVNRTE
jgi:hypothetical protein